MQNERHTSNTTLAVLFMAVALSACGGGGGSSAPAPAPAPGPAPAPAPAGAKAEGYYQGTINAAAAPNFDMAVLEDDSYWAIYRGTTSTAYIAGFVQGQGLSGTGGVFISANALDFGSRPPIGATLNATYTTAMSIAGTFTATAGSGTLQFTGAVPATSAYNYNTAASNTAVVGTWNVGITPGEASTLTVNSAGSFTGTAVSVGGCTFTGTIVPRPSGKNIFNVTLTIGPQPCKSPGYTGTGIGVTYPLASGGAQLIVTTVNSGRTAGVLALGNR